MKYHELSPFNYVASMCEGVNAKILFSIMCSGVFFLFGDNLMPLVIAIALVVVDTVIGVSSARYSGQQITSKKAWRLIPKLTAVFSAFITANLIGQFEPTLNEPLRYLVASGIIFTEGKSIYEHVGDIYPTLDVSKIIEKLKIK